MLVGGFGVIVADAGQFQATGFLLQCPAAPSEAILAAVKAHLLPKIRKHFHASRIVPAKELEVWPYTCGFSLPRMGTVRSTGYFVRHPAASHDTILRALEIHFLPMIISHIAETLKRHRTDDAHRAQASPSEATRSPRTDHSLP